MDLVLGDIVHMETDAIACPSHSDLRPMPGIREAVFRAADGEKLRKLCKEKGRCPIGKVVITPSCGLPCRYILHVVGPGWYSGREADRRMFASCYQHALHVAHLYQCRSVALPLMFSGEPHLPRAQALTIVLQVIGEFEQHHPDMQVSLVLYKPSIYHLAEKLYARLQEGTLSDGRRHFPRRKKQ